MSTKAKTKSEKMDFNADVSRLLNIVTNALYTNNDVFLRELISNSADACDRLRYDAIQKPELTSDNPDFRIHIYKDTTARTLTIVDNGIGMTRKELIDHLGTIAKSGTAKLMEKMKGQDDPLKLIGQFGVGFYASYMVADKVSVVSRKAGKKTVNVWVSDGASGFEMHEASAKEMALLDGDRGTAITLNLKDEGSDFLLDEKIRQTVQQYSDHIDVKIFLCKPEDTDKGEGQPINQASAIWRRAKSEIKKDQYTEFYRHITHGFDEPLLTSHWKAEGVMEYSALLFIPTMRPWDLYDPSRANNVKLYVRRVLISNNLEGLMYPWMRFMRGVIDSEDLPLNISRESLQFNPILQKIRSSVTKRILGDLDKLSREDEPAFITFWGQFGPAVKEGLYDAANHRDEIFKICRFYSTHDDGETLISLNDYVERMSDEQKEIYYIAGENLESLKNSPQLEGFRANKIEVLFFTDTVDEFWLQQVTDYKEKTFKSVTKGDIDLPDTEHKNEPENEDIKAFLKKMKNVLSEQVEDVRLSKRLKNSPVCLVAPEGGMDMNMERVLKINQKYQGHTKPVLEVNTAHGLIQKMQTLNDNDKFESAVLLLFDQAMIIQGEPIKDPTDFVRRMSAFLEQSL